MRALLFKEQIYNAIEQVQAYFTQREYLDIFSVFFLLISIFIPFITYKALSKFKDTRKSRFYYIHNESSFNSILSAIFRKITKLWFVALAIFTSSYLFWSSSWSLLSKPLFQIGGFFLLLSLFVQVYRTYQFKFNESRLRLKLKLTLSVIFIICLSLILIEQGKVSYTIYVLTFIAISVFWKKEIKDSILSIAFVGKYLEGLFDKKLYIVLIPFFLPFSLLNHFFHKVTGIFSKQELYIKIANQIMKTKLAGAYDKELKTISMIPETYRFLFNKQSINDTSFMYSFPENTFGKIESQILEWLDSKTTEQSLAIIGKEGSGKTSILRALKRSSKLSSCQVIHKELNRKLTCPSEVNKLISQLFKTDFDGGVQALIDYDKSISPTIIILDNFHNIFLSQEDGLEAIKYFIQLINAETKNIYWVGSFDYYSWSFLRNVLGQKYFFRHQVRLPRWDTSSIKSMIKTRHHASGYSLNFDLIQEALNRNQDDKITSNESEEKFFNLLAHQANHIPGLALAYWTNAVRVESYKKISVFLPQDDIVNFDKLQLEDSSLFVYASILRHVSLNSKQVITVTSLPKGAVANALKLGIEKEFLNRDSQGSYRTSSLKQRSLISYLSKKNFIYE